MQQNPETDERLGLPSASSFARIAQCRGSHRFESMFPETYSEDADEGTMLHSVMDGSMPEAFLNEDQVEACHRAHKFVDSILDELGMNRWDEVAKEKRYWLYDGETPIASGKVDAVFASGGVGLIVDYKFGYRKVRPAHRNWQLRGYAIMTMDAMPYLNEIYAAIVQPRLISRDGRKTLGRYKRSVLESSRGTLVGMLKEAETSTRLIAGPECMYCKALHACEEGYNYLISV